MSNNIEHQREHFNSIAKEYYTARRNKNHLQYKKRLFSHVLRNIPIRNDKKIRILEPMCGYGEGKQIIEEYITRDVIYEGFDYSDVLIDEIKTNSHEMNVWKQNVIEYVPKDNEYDCIILIGGLHHVPDNAKDVVSRLAGGLREGGIFINFEPTNNNPLIAVIRGLIYRKNHIFDDTTERAFSIKSYNGMFSDAGLEIERQFYPGLLGYVLYYNPDAFPWLNIGNEKTVNAIVNFEKKLYSNFIGRWFSFCTFSVFYKNEA